MEIRDRVAVVTGAASGIGAATARALAGAGARAVLLADINDEGLERVALDVQGLGAEARAVPCDLRITRDIEVLLDRALDHFGQLDILHNNAGVSSGTPYWPDEPVYKIEAGLDVNLKAVVIGTRLAIDRMRDNGGAIINTASMAAMVPFPPEAAYCAAKAGVAMFTRACAPLGESHGIRVNCVCPGIVETPMLRDTGAKPGEMAEYLQPAYDALAPLAPEEIADAVLALIRDDTKAGVVVELPNEPRKPAS
jgi:NAD(P)-dependent dehydrogenase (short-subunit alcohol dehydrogenase family)